MYRRGGNLPPATYRYLSRTTKRYPAGCIDGVAPFIRTGYKCHVAGGRFAAPTSKLLRNTVCNQNDKTMRKHCRKCPKMMGKRGKKRNGNKEKVRA